MGNVIQSGIYKITLFVLSLLFSLNTFGQDYYVDLQGDTQYVEISNWFFNQFYFKSEKGIEASFCDDFLSVYREQSELEYQAYSSFDENSNYVDFLLPTIASFRALSTDYYRDEHIEMWMSDSYVIYKCKSPNYTSKKELLASYSNLANAESYEEKFNNPRLFKNKESELKEIPSDVIFIYHDSLGFAKIVSSDIEQDYYELLFSRYSMNPSLNEGIFSGDFKLKQKEFLSIFSEYVSPLTAAQFNDNDLASYYISSLKDGALIVLLNLEMKKIKLYRDAGNNKLADQLEKDLHLDNLSYFIGFNEPEVFNFCKVYVAEAKHRKDILNGTSSGVFLNAELKIDSSIVLEEKFVLFARKGQVFETQAINQSNQKKKTVTSTPVVQDAMIIYDHENVQLMDPFPLYTREATAFFAKSSSRKSEQFDYKLFSKYLKDKYGYTDLNKSNLAVASSMNRNFIQFYKKSKRQYTNLHWKNSRVYSNGSWINRPYMVTDLF